jgi:predicted  nucleic acid-binding Zn-ribbon protein
MIGQQFLGLDLDDLYDLQGELARQTESLEARQELLTALRDAAELELRTQEFDALGEAIDAVSDELGPLQDRLEEVDDEISWRSERESRRYSPMVL